MRTHSTSRSARRRIDPALVSIAKPSQPRSASIHLLTPSTAPGKHRSMVRNTRMPPNSQNAMAEVMADIDGFPVLVRLLVKDIPAKMQSDFVANGADVQSLLSIKLGKIVDRMRDSSLQGDPPPKPPLAVVEPESGDDLLAGPPAQPNDTVLHVGPLELDLLDRTAKRGERQIELRPREFRLLKYMMQRSDKLLTRAILLKDVWNYKFVPETNLVDVHMGRLRRKVDGPNESPMISNVRGVGFVLSAAPLSQGSSSRPTERSENLSVADNSPRSAETAMR
jgi:DNA-binding winged helix-turn-helix (wHTH) protein